MTPTLLKSQFDRLARDPGDPRLLKGLAVEFGAAVIRSRPESLREYRVAAAAALRALEEKASDDVAVVYARGVLSALLDAAACAEEALTAERERDEVRAVASRPPHRAALRALEGQALTTTALAEKLGRQKSQMSEALRELEAAGLICAVAAQGGDGRSKPYRLTLTGLTLLDELPADEPAVGATVVANQGQPAPATSLPNLSGWLDQLDRSFEDLVEANVRLFSAPGHRSGRVTVVDATHGRTATHLTLTYSATSNAPPAAKPAPRHDASWDEQTFFPVGRNRLAGAVGG